MPEPHIDRLGIEVGGIVDGAWGTILSSGRSDVKPSDRQRRRTVYAVSGLLCEYWERTDPVFVYEDRHGPDKWTDCPAGLPRMGDIPDPCADQWIIAAGMMCGFGYERAQEMIRAIWLEMVERMADRPAAARWAYKIRCREIAALMHGYIEPWQDDQLVRDWRAEFIGLYGQEPEQ